MVAYSFKQQFAEPILSLRKAQTIRAPRKRDPRPGEELQLYTGMRTRKCRLLARATCSAVDFIAIGLNVSDRRVRILIGEPLEDVRDLNAFAQADGFADIGAMLAFWIAENGMGPGTWTFTGTLIRWDPLGLRDGEFALRNPEPDTSDIPEKGEAWFKGARLRPGGGAR